MTNAAVRITPLIGELKFEDNGTSQQSIRLNGLNPNEIRVIGDGIAGGESLPLIVIKDRDSNDQNASVLLPGSLGLSLGSSSLRWKIFGTDLDLTGSFTIGTLNGALYTNSGVVTVGTLPINRGGTNNTTFTDGVLIKKETGNARLIPATPGTDYASSGYANLLDAPNTGTGPLRLRTTTSHVGTIQEWIRGNTTIAKVDYDGAIQATNFRIGSNPVVSSLFFGGKTLDYTLYGPVKLKAGTNVDFVFDSGDGSLVINSSAADAVITGSGSVNQVPYFTTSTNIGGDTGFVYDAINKRLGVNAPSPMKTLEIGAGGMRLHSDASFGIDLDTTRTVDNMELDIQPSGPGYGVLLRLLGNNTSVSQPASRVELYAGSNDRRLVYVGLGTEHVISTELTPQPIIFKNGIGESYDVQGEVLRLGTDGYVGINNPDAAAGRLHIKSGGQYHIGLIIEGDSSQSGNLFETRTTTLVSRFTVNSQGIPELYPVDASVANELRWYELAANGSNYVAFRAPDEIGSNATTHYILPYQRPPATAVLTAISVSGDTVQLGWSAGGSGGGSLPAGTDGQTIRYNNTIAEASSVLTNTGFRVGIQNTEPSATLHVNGSNTSLVTTIIESLSGQTADLLQFQDGQDNAVLAYFDVTTRLALPYGTVGSPALRFTGDTDTGVYHSSINSMSLVTGGNDRLRVLASGNVMMGLDSPTMPTIPTANATSTNRFLRIYGGTDSYVQFYNSNGLGRNGYIGMSGMGMVVSATDGISFRRNTTDDSTSPLATGTETMGLLSDGRVVINLAYPDSRLSVGSGGDTQAAITIAGGYGQTGDLFVVRPYNDGHPRMGISADGRELRFYEDNYLQNNYTAFRAPDSIRPDADGNLVYTLPTSGPTNNQALHAAVVSDGAYNLFWATPNGDNPIPAGTPGQTLRFNDTSQLEANSNLYNSGTAVGVGGAPTSGYKFGIKHSSFELGFHGNPSLGMFEIVNPISDQGLHLNGLGGYLSLYANSHNYRPGEVAIGGGNSNSGFVTIQTWNGSTNVNRFQITAGSVASAVFQNVTVGIGEPAPQARLHINAGGINEKGLVVRAHTNYTTNLFEAQADDQSPRVLIDLGGNLQLHSGLDPADLTRELRFYQRNYDGAEYVAFKAPELMAMGSTVTYVWPFIHPIAGQYLKATEPDLDGVSFLSWGTPSGGGGGGGGGGTVTQVSGTAGILTSPAIGITDSGLVTLDTAYAPTWTARHTFAFDPNGTTPSTIRVTGTGANTGARHAMIEVGSGGFAGSAFHFDGHSGGTLMGFNAGSLFTGNVIDIQKAGTAGSDSIKLFSVTNTGAVMLGYSGYAPPTGRLAQMSSGNYPPSNSAGYRLVLYPFQRGDGNFDPTITSTDVAIGIEENNMFFTSNGGYKFYSSGGQSEQYLRAAFDAFYPYFTIYPSNGYTAEIRLKGTSNNNYLGFRAPNNITSQTTWTLPPADGTNGQVLTTNGSGVLFWAASGSGSGGGTIGGSGTIGQIPLFVTTSNIGNSSLSQTTSTYTNDTIRHSSRAPRFQIIDNDTPGITSGFKSENGGQVSHFGANYGPLATRLNAYQGGYLRFDLRTGQEAEFFNIHNIAASTGTDTKIWAIGNDGTLNTGSIPMARLSGVLPIIRGGTNNNAFNAGEVVYAWDNALEGVPNPITNPTDSILAWRNRDGQPRPTWVDTLSVPSGGTGRKTISNTELIYGWNGATDVVPVPTSNLTDYILGWKNRNGSVIPTWIDTLSVSSGGTGRKTISNTELIYGWNGATDVIPAPTSNLTDYVLGWENRNGSVIPTWVARAGVGSIIPSGTAGHILYLTTNGVLAQHDALRFVDGSNPSAGVGLSTGTDPQATLHVQQSGARTGLLIRKNDSDAAGALLRLDNSPTQPRFVVKFSENFEFYGVSGNGASLRLYESDSEGTANFVALKAPATLSQDVTYLLPSSPPPSSGAVLQSSVVSGGLASLSWTSISGGVPGTAMPIYLCVPIVATQKGNPDATSRDYFSPEDFGNVCRAFIDLTDFSEFMITMSCNINGDNNTLQGRFYVAADRSPTILTGWHDFGPHFTFNASDLAAYTDSGDNFQVYHTGWETIPNDVRVEPCWIGIDDYMPDGEVYSILFHFRGAKLGVAGPKGDSGDTGSPGLGLTYRNTWISGTSYVVNDIVYRNGSGYICIQGHSSTQDPLTASAYWSLIVLKGADATLMIGQAVSSITTTGGVLYTDGSGNLAQSSGLIYDGTQLSLNYEKFTGVTNVSPVTGQIWLDSTSGDLMFRKSGSSINLSNPPSALVFQNNGSSLGTAGTLNFGSGLSASINSGIVTVTAMGAFSGSINANQVVFATGSNALGGSNNLWWDNVNAKLGIFTNSPSANLDVRQSATSVPVLSLKGITSTTAALAQFLTSDAIIRSGVDKLGHLNIFANTDYNSEIRFYGSGTNASKFIGLAGVNTPGASAVTYVLPTNVPSQSNMALIATSVPDGNNHVALDWTSSVTANIAIGSSVTSGTTGSILFVDSSANLAQSNSNLFWDNANKRLGINQTTPNGAIHAVPNSSNTVGVIITAAASQSANLLEFRDSNNSTALASYNSTGQLRIGSGTAIANIDSGTGTFGGGTYSGTSGKRVFLDLAYVNSTNDSAAAFIQPINSAVTQFYQTNTYGTADLLMFMATNSTSAWGAVEAYGSAGLILSTGGNSNPISFRINRNERLRLTNTGLQFVPYSTASGATTELRFLELAASGTSYTGFKAPDNLTAQIGAAAGLVYVLPNTAPSSGYVLQASAPSSGISALSWVSPGSFSSVAIQSAGSGIGSVGTLNFDSGLTVSITGGVATITASAGSGISSVSSLPTATSGTRANLYLVQGIGAVIAKPTVAQNPQSNPGSSLRTGLVHDWLMNEGNGTYVRDMVGGNNLALSTNINWATLSADASNPVLQGNGSQTAIVTPNNASITGDYSIALSIRTPSTWTGGYQTIVSWETGVTSSLSITPSSNKFIFYDATTGVGASLVSNSTISLDTNYIVVITYNVTTGQKTIYINGTQDAQANQLFSFAGGPLRFFSNSFNERFNGHYKWSRVYNRVLTPTEVNTLSRQPFGDYNIPSSADRLYLGFNDALGNPNFAPVVPTLPTSIYIMSNVTSPVGLVTVSSTPVTETAFPGCILTTQNMAGVPVVISANIWFSHNNVGNTKSGVVRLRTGSITGPILDSWAYGDVADSTNGHQFNAFGGAYTYTDYPSVPNQTYIVTIQETGTNANSGVVYSDTRTMSAMAGYAITATSNFTAGQVAFSGLGNAMSGSSNLYWDNTSTRLGIGTSSPLVTLHVAGYIWADTATNSTGIRIKNSSAATNAKFWTIETDVSQNALQINATNDALNALVASPLTLFRSGRLLFAADAVGQPVAPTNAWTHFKKKTTSTTDSVVAIGDDIAVSTAATRAKLIIGNTSDVSEMYLAQSASVGLGIAWQYNATTTAAYGVIDAGNSPITLQNTANTASRLTIGTNTPFASLPSASKVYISTGVAGLKGLVIQGVASQGNNLQEWLASGSTNPFVTVDQYGYLKFYGASNNNPSDGQLYVDASGDLNFRKSGNPINLSTGSGGGALTVKSNGSALGTATVLDFGSGTTVSFSSGTATITASGGGGGTTFNNVVNAQSATVLTAQMGSNITVTTTPTVNTIWPNCSVTVPASNVARWALVNFDGSFTKVANNLHVFLQLDGSSFTGQKYGGPLNSDNGEYPVSFAGIVVAIPGDSAPHTIAPYYNAAGGTAATTFTQGNLSIILIPQVAGGTNIGGTAIGTTSGIRVNCAGAINGAFGADAYCITPASINQTTATTQIITATNAGPMTLYQTYKQGSGATNVQYSITNLYAGMSYVVRLHFTEPTYSASGSRKFNVVINGTTVATNFDIYATAGAANTAVVSTYSVIASGSGAIDLQLVAVTDNPIICGIEVIPPTGAVTGIGTPGTPGVSANTPLYTNANTVANRPIAGTAELLFFPTDGVTISRDNGSGWMNWGPTWPLYPTKVSDWTVVQNTVSTTLTDLNGSMSVAMPLVGDGNAPTILSRSMPASTGTITSTYAVLATLWGNSYNRVGFGFYETATNVVTSLCMCSVGAAQTVKWTLPTSAAQVNQTANIFNNSGVVWVRVSYDFTAHQATFSISRDNVNFYLYQTLTRSAMGFTSDPDKIAFTIDNSGTPGLYTAALLLSYYDGTQTLYSGGARSILGGGQGNLYWQALSGTATFSSGALSGDNVNYGPQLAFDGTLTTAFASDATSGGYVGTDLGTTTPPVVSMVAFAPRPTYASRMVGGKIQGSNISSTSGYVDLYAITVAPTDGTLTYIPLSGTTPYRYLRYYNSGNYADIAELQVFSAGVSAAGGTGGRRLVTVTTATLAANATDATLSVPMGKLNTCVRITTSAAAWVRVYSTPAYRTADAGRLSSLDPAVTNSGVLLDQTTSAGQLTLDLAPGAQLFSLEATPSNNLAVSVTNISGISQAITVTFTSIFHEV